MKQIFTLTVQGESEAEVLACLAKMNSETALSVIAGQIGAGCISDGSYPTVQWTYRAARQPTAKVETVDELTNRIMDAVRKLLLIEDLTEWQQETYTFEYGIYDPALAGECIAENSPKVGALDDDLYSVIHAAIIAEAGEANQQQPDTRKLYRVDIHSTDEDYDALALLTEDEATKIEAKLDDQFRTQREDNISGRGVELDLAEVPLDFTALTSWLDGVAEDIEPTHDSDGEPLDD